MPSLVWGFFSFFFWCVYHVLSLLSLLHISVGILMTIKRIYIHFSSNIYFLSLLSGTPVIHILVCSILSYRLMEAMFIIKKIFPLPVLALIISIVLLPSSSTLSLVACNVLWIPSNKWFYLKYYLFSFRISLNSYLVFPFLPWKIQGVVMGKCSRETWR